MNRRQTALAEIERVASLVIPPVDPLRIMRDRTRGEDNLIPTLRGFVGIGLMAAGFSKTEIAHLFGQAYTTTDSQMERCAKRSTEPRFSQILTK